MTKRQKKLIRRIVFYSKLNKQCSFQVNGADAKALLKLIKSKETESKMCQCGEELKENCLPNCAY